MKFLFVLSLAAFATQLHAGASNAKLSCQATNAGGSGITLEGEIPGDFAEFNLTLVNRNGALKYSDADGTATTVIAFSQGVFTLALQLNDGRASAVRNSKNGKSQRR